VGFCSLEGGGVGVFIFFGQGVFFLLCVFGVGGGVCLVGLGVAFWVWFRVWRRTGF